VAAETCGGDTIEGVTGISRLSRRTWLRRTVSPRDSAFAFVVTADSRDVLYASIRGP
jgi:hypothetical protein